MLSALSTRSVRREEPLRERASVDESRRSARAIPNTSGQAIDRQGANLFFQLASRRYERGSIIITSNQSPGA